MFLLMSQANSDDIIYFFAKMFFSRNCMPTITGMAAHCHQALKNGTKENIKNLQSS